MDLQRQPHGRTPVRAGAPSRVPADERELDALFDRYLALFNAASRRFANLFPYNHLRHSLLKSVGRAPIEVLIRSERHEPVAKLCAFDDGAIVRVPGHDGPPAVTWELARETIEDASAQPWLYLAHPDRFAFGWFLAQPRARMRLPATSFSNGSTLQPPPERREKTC